MELHRGESADEKALAVLFNGDASATNPATIAQPCDEQEVAVFVRQAGEQKRPLQGRSGGHSDVNTQPKKLQSSATIAEIRTWFASLLKACLFGNKCRTIMGQIELNLNNKIYGDKWKPFV